mgnify:CR=1 FL=1
MIGRRDFLLTPVLAGLSARAMAGEQGNLPAPIARPAVDAQSGAPDHRGGTKRTPCEGAASCMAEQQARREWC